MPPYIYEPAKRAGWLPLGTRLALAGAAALAMGLGLVFIGQSFANDGVGIGPYVAAIGWPFVAISVFCLAMASKAAAARTSR